MSRPPEAECLHESLEFHGRDSSALPLRDSVPDSGRRALMCVVLRVTSQHSVSAAQIAPLRPPLGAPGPFGSPLSRRVSSASPWSCCERSFLPGALPAPVPEPALSPRALCLCWRAVLETQVCPHLQQ